MVASRALWAACAALCASGAAQAVDQVLRSPLTTWTQPDLVIAGMRLDSACRVVVSIANSGRSNVPDSVWTTRALSGITVTVDGQPFAADAFWQIDPARRLQPPGGTVDYVTPRSIAAGAMVGVRIVNAGAFAEASEANNLLNAPLQCLRGAALLARPPKPAAVPPAGTDENTGPPPKPAPDAEEPAPPSPGPAQIPRQSFGSLLDAQLPPPPADAPKVAPRDDDVESGEVLVVSGDMAQAQSVAQAAQGSGYGVKRRSALPALGMVVTTLRVPRGAGVGDALRALRDAQPQAWIDANHRFALIAGEARPASGKGRVVGARNACGSGISLGVVAPAPDTAHPALQGRSIVTRSFLPAGVAPARSGVGTAISALLLADAPPGAPGGLAPQAKLFAAAAFRSAERGDETTAEWLVRALDWVAAQGADVVDLPVSGPRNLIVEAALERAYARGMALVGAAGDASPGAPAPFPAAQPRVVAVTAVDADLRVWSGAGRGAHVRFAAPGVALWAPAPGAAGSTLTGTPYATAFVVAALAAARQADRQSNWDSVLQALERGARDLGVSGRDDVYGWGLIESPPCASKRRGEAGRNG